MAEPLLWRCDTRATFQQAGLRLHSCPARLLGSLRSALRALAQRFRRARLRPHCTLARRVCESAESQTVRVRCGSGPCGMVVCSIRVHATIDPELLGRPRFLQVPSRPFLGPLWTFPDLVDSQAAAFERISLSSLSWRFSRRSWVSSSRSAVDRRA